jgi:multidrug efflux pump subunit AcrB
MKLTDYAVKHSQFTLVVFACLAALGLTSFLTIPRLEDPNLKIPSFIVVAVYPGANATDIEQLVARPLEDAFKELDDIDKIRSSVKDGYVSVTVEFFFGTDPEKKYDEILRQVNVERGRLPSGVTEIDVRKNSDGERGDDAGRAGVTGGELRAVAGSGGDVAKTV